MGRCGRDRVEAGRMDGASRSHGDESNGGPRTGRVEREEMMESEKRRGMISGSVSPLCPHGVCATVSCTLDLWPLICCACAPPHLTLCSMSAPRSVLMRPAPSPFIRNLWHWRMVRRIRSCVGVSAKRDTGAVATQVAPTRKSRSNVVNLFMMYPAHVLTCRSRLQRPRPSKLAQERCVALARPSHS